MTEMVRASVEDARRLTERIRMTAVSVSEKIDRLKELVTQAKESEAHIALGYASWTAYLADVLGETPMRLERDVRQELVTELSEQGMSTRAIAPIVGVDNKTVHNDLKRGVENSTPESNIDYSTGEVSDSFMAERLGQAETNNEVVKLTGEGSVSSPRVVTGLDGKTYSAPATTTPKRRALGDDFFDIAYRINQTATKLADLTRDDRYNRNKKEIANNHLGTLRAAQTIINNLVTELEKEETK